jgi:hypothetical protein
MNSLISHLDNVTALFVAISALLGAFWGVARTVLLVLDALDDRFPKLRRITDPLGTLTGGSKQRGRANVSDDVEG